VGVDQKPVSAPHTAFVGGCNNDMSCAGTQSEVEHIHVWEGVHNVQVSGNIPSKVEWKISAVALS